MRKALNQIRSQQRASSSDRGTGDALNYFMPGRFGRVPSWVDGVAKPHLPTSPLFHFSGEPPIGQPHSPSESHWPVDGQATPWPNTNGNWGSIEWPLCATLLAAKKKKQGQQHCLFEPQFLMQTVAPAIAIARTFCSILSSHFVCSHHRPTENRKLPPNAGSTTMNYCMAWYVGIRRSR